MNIITNAEERFIFMNIRSQIIRFNRIIIKCMIVTVVIGSSGALAQEWVPLNGNLIPENGGLVRPSLAADPRVNPVLGFNNFENGAVSVVRWRGDAWESIGPDIEGTSGPSIGLDAQKRIFLCQSGKYATPGAALNVFRFNDKAWSPIGGDVAAEAGYITGPRHVVDACGGIALDSSGNPIVSWEALVGAKSWAVFAARWDEDQKSWKGLGDGHITGGRAVTTYVDIDANDRPYLATTNTNGYGIGRVTTTQVWRWNDHVWVQLGADMPGAENTVIGVYENTPYLVLHYVESDPATGDILIDELRVMRWRQGSWQTLPSPGNGIGIARPALDFTSSGKPVVAYIESLEEGKTLNVLVKRWTGKTWENVGDAVASVTCSLPSCYPDVSLDLSLDSQGRPIVAWGETNYTLASDGSYTPVSRLEVRRYSNALP